MNPVIFMTALGLLVNVILSFGVHHGEHIDSGSKLPCKFVIICMYMYRES